MSAPENSTRRNFFAGMIYALWGIISAALAMPAAVYLFLPPRTKKEDQWVEAGDISRLRLREPEELVFRRNRVDGWKISSEKSSAWVVRTSASEVVAFAPQCTHLGCAYHWNEQRQHFVCPCHTSAFGIDGKVLTGPAPRALDRYEIRLRNEKLLIGQVRKSA